MVGPTEYMRPLVLGVLTLIVFILLIVAMSVEIFSVTITYSTRYYSTSSSASFTVFSSGLEDNECSGFPDIVRAPRAFLILAILGVLPCAVLVALDALKKTAVLGPIAPHFRFVMAGVAGYMAFCLIIAWPIMMALPSKVKDCVGSAGSVKVSAAPFIALIAWLMLCAMIVVAVCVPAPPQETPAEAEVVTGVVVSTTTKPEKASTAPYGAGTV